MAKKHRRPIGAPILDDFSPEARTILHTIRSNAAAIALEPSEERAKAWIAELFAPLSPSDRKRVLGAIVHDQERKFACAEGALLKAAVDPSLPQMDRLRLVEQVARWRVQLDEGRASAEKLLEDT